MEVGQLYVLLKLQAEQYEAGLVKAKDQATGFGGSAGSAFAAVGEKVALMGAAVIGTAVGIAVKGLEMADTLQKAQALVKAAYGSTTAALESWTNKNQVALGVNETDLSTNLATWGIYAKGIGQSTDQAAASGEALATRAAQISAVTGQSFDDVFTALEKGVQGATKGLKQYGVAIDPVVLKNEAMTLGIYNGKGALDLSQKALATQALILQQTTPYVDAFGTAQQSAGFQIKDMGVVVDQTMIAIGDAVTPIAAKVLPLFAKGVQMASDFIIQNLPVAMDVVGKLGDVVSTVFGTLTTVLMDVTNQGKDAGPTLEALGLLVGAVVVPPFLVWAAATIAATWPIVAIGAAVLVVVGILNHFGLMASIVNIALKTIGDTFHMVGQVIGVVTGVVQFFANIIETVANFIGGVMNAVSGSTAATGDAVVKSSQNTADQVTNIYEAAAPKAAAAVNATTTAIAGAFDQGYMPIQAAAASTLAAIPEVASGAYQRTFKALSTLPGDIASAILAARKLPQDAYALLLADEKTSLKPMAEIAKLNAELASAAVKTGLASGDPAVKAQAQATVQAIEDQLSGLQGPAKTFGKNTGLAYAAGLGSSVDSIAQAAAYALSKAKQRMAAFSPPGPESPLHDIDKWGLNTGKAYASGLAGAAGHIASAFTGLGITGPTIGAGIASPAPGLGAAGAASVRGGNGGRGGGAVNFGPINVTGVNDPEAIAKAILLPLTRQLSRQKMSLA
jgi:phage-related protein